MITATEARLISQTDEIFHDVERLIRDNALRKMRTAFTMIPESKFEAFVDIMTNAPLNYEVEVMGFCEYWGKPQKIVLIKW